MKRLAPKLLIVAAIILISALHFLTPIERLTAHEVYQRLYYLPIVAAAFLFGLRGGMLSALLVSAAYVPHIVLQWHHQPGYSLNQYAEIVLFFFFALITGALSDRNRRETARAEKNAAELQEAYSELRQTFEQLLQAERLAALGELSAGIVHEIRNPLASIKGAIEILEDGLSAVNPRREFASIAKIEVERINKLVEEFVAYARAPKLAKSLVDVNELAGSVNILLEQQAAGQNVSLETDFADSLPLVSLDPEQIKQVLLNLGINALQAMPRGGKLIFRTRRTNDSTSVEVEDTGGGIPQDKLNRIFDPFFTTKKKGLGLGLSMAHKIVAEHKGELCVSNTSQGVTFSIAFHDSSS